MRLKNYRVDPVKDKPKEFTITLSVSEATQDDLRKIRVFFLSLEEKFFGGEDDSKQV